MSRPAKQPNDKLGMPMPRRKYCHMDKPAVRE